MNFKKENDVPGIRSWKSECGKYLIDERPQPSQEPIYFCYRKESFGNKRYRFMGYRHTPEHAMEYCNSLAGEK